MKPVKGFTRPERMPAVRSAIGLTPSANLRLNSMHVTMSISIGFRKWTSVNFLPPDHWPFRCSANDRAPALDAVWRFNGDHLDASRVNGKVIVEGWLIKIAVYRAKVGE